MLLSAGLWLGAAQAGDDPAIRLDFRDFLAAPMGREGIRWSPALLAADGRSVQLVGYMVKQESPPAGGFMLTPRPVQMSEDSDGAADDLPPTWVMVHLDPSQAHHLVPYTSGPIQLTGVLSVGRAEEADGRVSWLRLQLAPEAVRELKRS
ncbi:hypothetical protein [Paludibacterium purpuratum]|uniref:hypothetical protein n=1 Tax=Paludibacterium purpuratum TaxID=1144873 RepID=UPI00105FD901|nr:hypothetical protein [Paludibacterium purpuratum]